MENINLTINGIRVSGPKGASLLEAAERHGINIPHLCYHHVLNHSDHAAFAWLKTNEPDV